MNFEQQEANISELNIENESGTVSPPKGLEWAHFLSDGFEKTFQKPDGTEMIIRIDPDKLKDILLTINGTTLFKCMEGRFFILAKVNNVHIPFYQSSAGTGGKTASIWHPYFGISNDGWIIKGKIAADGSMLYHDAITNVQHTLNENLILLNGGYYSAGGKIGTNRSSTDFEPQNVIFDINEHLNYKFWAHDDKYRSDPANGERQMLIEHTGYDPNGIGNPNVDESEIGKPTKWINDIISNIKDT